MWAPKATLQLADLPHMSVQDFALCTLWATILIKAIKVELEVVASDLNPEC